jgi:hypothetical protein
MVHRAAFSNAGTMVPHSITNVNIRIILIDIVPKRHQIGSFRHLREDTPAAMRHPCRSPPESSKTAVVSDPGGGYDRSPGGNLVVAALRTVQGFSREWRGYLGLPVPGEATWRSAAVERDSISPRLTGAEPPASAPSGRPNRWPSA